MCVIIVISETIKTPRNCIFIASLVTTSTFSSFSRTQVNGKTNFLTYGRHDSWHETKRNTVSKRVNEWMSKWVTKSESIFFLKMRRKVVFELNLSRVCMLLRVEKNRKSFIFKLLHDLSLSHVHLALVLFCFERIFNNAWAIRRKEM